MLGRVFLHFYSNRRRSAPHNAGLFILTNAGTMLLTVQLSDFTLTVRPYSTSLFNSRGLGHLNTSRLFCLLNTATFVCVFQLLLDLFSNQLVHLKKGQLKVFVDKYLFCHPQ